MTEPVAALRMPDCSEPLNKALNLPNRKCAQEMLDRSNQGFRRSPFMQMSSR